MEVLLTEGEECAGPPYPRETGGRRGMGQGGPDAKGRRAPGWGRMEGSVSNEKSIRLVRGEKFGLYDLVDTIDERGEGQIIGLRYAGADVVVEEDSVTVSTRPIEVKVRFFTEGTIAWLDAQYVGILE